MSNQLNSSQFRCCFGILHVKTACIIIGAWHLVKFSFLIWNQFFFLHRQFFLFAQCNFQILNLFALTLLGIIAKNPTIVHHSSDSRLDDDGIDALPTPVSRNIVEQDPYRDHSLNHNDIDMVCCYYTFHFFTI